MAVISLAGCHTPDRHASREEYKFLRLVWGDKDSPDNRLNELAQQGWKIKDSQISYVPYVFTGNFMFVRPVQ
jgi:hypothetical protein